MSIRTSHCIGVLFIWRSNCWYYASFNRFVWRNYWLITCDLQGPYPEMSTFTGNWIIILYCNIIYEQQTSLSPSESLVGNKSISPVCIGSSLNWGTGWSRWVMTLDDVDLRPGLVATLNWTGIRTCSGMWRTCHAGLYIPARLWVELASLGSLRLKCDGIRAETRFLLSAKRTSPFKSVGASVQSTTGSRGVRISGSNAGCPMFRDSMKSTGYPLRQFPFTSPPVRHRVSSHFNWTLLLSHRTPLWHMEEWKRSSTYS